MAVVAAPGGNGPAPPPINLNLSSSTPTVSGSGFTTPVVINAGGAPKVVNSSSVLTPAEYVAATQVQSGGIQSLNLSVSGVATGGHFVTNPFLGNLSGMTVPNGVTAVQDFSPNSSLDIAGNLVNAGRFYAVSTNSHDTMATFNATNITNQQGALLSSIVPAGFNIISGVIANLNMTLNAVSSIVNNGIISSSGSLNLNAPSITNATLPGGGPQASIQATNNLSITAASVTNSGYISSLTGNASLQALTNSLIVQNVGGIISAHNSLNFTVAGNASTNSINVIGGILQGADATFDAGRMGTLGINVVDLPATLSLTGNVINLSISNGTHGLDTSGLTRATGGSLAYNGVGNVHIDGFNTNGGNISVNTTGSILIAGHGNGAVAADLNTTSASGTAGSVSLVTSGGSIDARHIITTGSGSGDGGDITLIAAHDINAGTLNASAVSGDPGDITVRAGTSGSGWATIGDIIAPGGTITLGESNTTVTGTVDVGNGTIHWELPDGLYVVDFAKLLRYGGSVVQVGGDDFDSDIHITTDCNGCLGDLTSLSFKTKGKYVATGTTLTLSDNTELNVTADGGINTGGVSAGAITFDTHGILQVDGNVGSHGKLSLVGGDITVDNGRSMSASAGDLWMVAANDILVNPGTTISSTANEAGTVGGRIGIMAGDRNFDMGAMLNAMQAARNGNELLSLPSGSAWDTQTNTITSTGGSNMAVVFPDGATKSVSNSTFNLNGGILYIDPPGTNNVSITGANFVVAGPAVVGGGNNGGGNNGGGNNGGGNNGGGNNGGGTGAGGTGTGGTGSLGNDLVNLINPILDGFGANGTNDLIGGTLFNTTATSTDTTSNTNNNANAITLSTVDLDGKQIGDSRQQNGQNTMRAAIYCAQPGTLKENESLKDENWIIAANKCQPFSFETPDGSIIVGTGPAIFAPTANRTLLLKEGKLLIIAGEGMIVVRTPMCNVTVPVNSAATVEFSMNGLTRLTGLAGGKASVSVTRQGETIILTAAPGEQLVLAEDAVPDTEMCCQPDVPNKKNESWLVRLAGLRGEKFSFDRTEMVSREGLLNCTLGCFTKLQQNMIDQIRKSMMLESPKELKSMLPARQRYLISKARTSHLSAVGFGQILDLTVPDLIAMKCTSALVKYAPGANISIIAPNQLALHGGDMLVSTNAATTILAGRYQVKVAPNTVATVSARNDHVTVRNIYESKLSSIQVTTPDSRCIGAQVGHEIIVGNPRMSFSSVLAEEAIGRRRMKHTELGQSGLITSEVSLLSLMQNTNILSQMFRSEHPDDKAILNKVMKMSCALSIATQRHGNYSMVGQ